MTYEEQCEQLILLARDTFPEYVEINTYYDGIRMSAIGRICWKLNNDESRPNKSSKIISIVIPAEALDDYNDSTVNQQERAQKRFKKYIQNQYKSFNPNHNMPEYQEAPSEEWLITTNLLNE